MCLCIAIYTYLHVACSMGVAYFLVVACMNLACSMGMNYCIQGILTHCVDCQKKHLLPKIF